MHSILPVLVEVYDENSAQGPLHAQHDSIIYCGWNPPPPLYNTAICTVRVQPLLVALCQPSVSIVYGLSVGLCMWGARKDTERGKGMRWF